MASSLTISSLVMFFCLSSLFLHAARAVSPAISNQLLRGSGGGSNDGLLKIACKVDDVPNGIPWDYNLCIKVLKSIPSVASSANLPNLALNIIHTGISNISNTYTYINNSLKRGSKRPLPVVKALKACKESYDHVFTDFHSAFGEVKNGKEEYLISTYDLMLARTDHVDICNNALASNKVVDQAISSGNKFAFFFSATAEAVIDTLLNETK